VFTPGWLATILHFLRLQKLRCSCWNFLCIFYRIGYTAVFRLLKACDISSFIVRVFGEADTLRPYIFLFQELLYKNAYLNCHCLYPFASASVHYVNTTAFLLFTDE
jgi:hypothetical protein